MTPQELLSEILLSGPPSDTLKLECRLIFRILADNLHEVRLSGAGRLDDLTDVIALFRELVKQLNPALNPVKPGYNVDFCPDCGHVHVDDHECSFPIGGGRVCRCERQVTA